MGIEPTDRCGPIERKEARIGAAGAEMQRQTREELPSIAAERNSDVGTETMTYLSLCVRMCVLARREDAQALHH